MWKAGRAFSLILGPLGGVIPAQAGIHVSQSFKWPPAFAGMTVVRDIFEIGFQQKTI
jgi:hypothetical protein